MHFADIKNDIAFRKIFGNEAKTEILLSFLNAVLQLKDAHKIVWVEILNPYQTPLVQGAKSSILDVKAKDEAGKEYIIEMQMTDKQGFAKRVVYYSAKSYAAQLDAAENYALLKPVIFIGILNFVFLETPNYISRHLILDAKTNEHKLKDLDFNFIELPKFTIAEAELKSPIDKWVYFIKNAENLSVIPTHIDDSGLHTAYVAADRHTWTKADVEAYEYANLREMDMEAEKMLVVEKAEQRGMERGLQQGMEQGIQQGMQQGMQQGEQQKSIAIARNAISKGLDNGLIAALTGLSIEQIEALR